MHTKYFFLLGGRDLEMFEIRKLLEINGFQEKYDFLDKQLSWGAKLSDYANDFALDRINVAIELTEDIPSPKQYLRIDHHNDYSNRPASIEQIAELLGIELTYYQQLVAANDKGYIPAMKAMGATEKEIAEIRQKDRQVQGVTKEDEDLAEQSIQKHLEVQKGVTIVYALTSRFATIADRLHGKTNNMLLIYNDNELTYYGICKDFVAELFNKLIEKK